MSEVIDRPVQQLGYTATKERQRTVVEGLVGGRDVFGILPTGRIRKRGGALPWIPGVTILVRKRCMRMGTRLEWGYAECAYEKVHWYGYCMLKRPDPFLLMRKGRVPRLLDELVAIALFWPILTPTRRVGVNSIFVAVIDTNELTQPYYYASVGGATRHTVVRLFVCLSFRLFLQFCGAR